MKIQLAIALIISLSAFAGQKKEKRTTRGAYVTLSGKITMQSIASVGTYLIEGNKKTLVERVRTFLGRHRSSADRTTLYLYV